MSGYTSALSEKRISELWAEHDRLRREIERLQERFSEVNDALMADLKARTGFPHD